MPLFSPTLQLGDFIFEGFEEPSAVKFGKQQQSHKHLLIGGGRVIDMLGASDPDITFSGYFTGATAQFRARYLESLCKSGQPLLLKTSQFVKQVVIAKFIYNFHYAWPIQYTMTLQVIQDETLPVNFQVPGDLTITILEQLFQAEVIASAIQNGSISSALAAALALAQAAAPFDGSNAAALSAAIAGMQNAINAVNSAITATESGIFG